MISVHRSAPFGGQNGLGPWSAVEGKDASLSKVFGLMKRAAAKTYKTDLDTVVSSTLTGLAELFGYEHSLLMLLDETGERLYTIASH